MPSQRVDPGMLLVKLGRLQDAGLVESYTRMEARGALSYRVTVTDGSQFIFRPREALAFVTGAELALKPIRAVAEMTAELSLSDGPGRSAAARQIGLEALGD